MRDSFIQFSTSYFRFPARHEETLRGTPALSRLGLSRQTESWLNVKHFLFPFLISTSDSCRRQRTLLSACLNMERGCLICLPRLPALPLPCLGLPSVYIPIFHSFARSLFIHSFFVYVRKHSHPLCRYLSRRSCFRSAASNCSPHLPLAGESASAALPAAFWLSCCNCLSI